MKKRVVKLLVALLAAVSMLASLVGCGGKKSDDVTIRIFLADPAGTDLKKVSDAVSDYVKEKLGFGVELVQFGAGEYDQKMSLALVSDEQVDLIWTAGDAFKNFAQDGTLVDLTEPLKEYAPKLKETVYEVLWQVANVNGGIYAVPALKEIANQWGFYVRTDFLKEKGIDVSQIKKMADLEIVLKAAVEDGREGLMHADAGWHEGQVWQPVYDQITGMYLVPQEAGNNKVFHWYMSDQYEEFAYLMRDWYQKGYIRKDILTNGQYTGDAETYGVRPVNYSPAGEGLDMTPILFGEPRVYTGLGSGVAIPAKSEYVEQTLKFIELWYTDPVLETLIHYGIEGEHYNMVEGRLVEVENREQRFLHQTWMGGNMMLSPLGVNDVADKWERYDEYNKRAEMSKCLGFTPNLSSLEAEVAAVNAVVGEYAKIIYTGVSDPAETLPDFRAALTQAGVQKVTDEIQRQFDAWMANKK